MKKLIYIILTSIIFIATTAILTNCSSSANNKLKSIEQKNHSQYEVANVSYSCPMHPEITGKEGERCSKCNMNLVKTEHKEAL